MDRIFISVFLLTIACVQGAAQGTSSVEWGERITSADFEASATKNDTAAANISVSILLGYSYGGDGMLTFKVAAVMDKKESWIKDEFKDNDEVLAHEQGHFDIAHIYARRLEASLKGKRYRRADVSILHEIYDTFLERMHELQKRYDAETRGGMDARAQETWRKFIEKEVFAIQLP